jgi:alpha-tubulin suppressor-like RCC1 family protein
MKTQKFAIAGLIASTLAAAADAFKRSPRTMPMWMVAAIAIVVGAGRQTRAEVDVVSWGAQTFDQGELRESYTQVAEGHIHTVALKSNGTLIAWGDNASGQCNVPSGLTGVTQVAAGGYHTVAQEQRNPHRLGQQRLRPV